MPVDQEGPSVTQAWRLMPTGPVEGSPLVSWLGIFTTFHSKPGRSSFLPGLGWVGKAIEFASWSNWPLCLQAGCVCSLRWFLKSSPPGSGGSSLGVLISPVFLAAGLMSVSCVVS